MRRSFFLVIFLGILIGVVVVGVLWVVTAQKQKDSVATPTPIAQPTSAPELVLWEDQAAFQFQYPKGIDLNPHPEDNEHYAQVELTTKEASGSLTVWVKDTTALSLDDFIKKQKIEGNIETLLGGEEAIKVLTGRLLQIFSLHNGYLYQIDLTSPDSPVWKQIFETVSSSFAFTDVEEIKEQKETQTTQQTEEFFEEEVIE